MWLFGLHHLGTAGLGEWAEFFAGSTPVLAVPEISEAISADLEGFHCRFELYFWIM
jgi:hypothetical protein